MEGTMLHPSVRKLSDRFVVAGTMSADQLRSAIETHAIASVVQLAAWPEPMLSDLSSASSLPSSFEAVPGADGFTSNVADNVCQKLHSAARPTLVVCASGARASAAVSIYEARQARAPPHKVVSHAMDISLPWADKAVLRHWVVEGIEAFEAQVLSELDGSLRRVDEETFVGGIISADTLKQAVSASGIKTVIQLVPFPEPMGRDLSAYLPDGTTANFLATGPPDGEYSTAAAAAVVAEIQAAAKPVLVLCRTGTRAAAAVDLARAEAEGLSADDMLVRAHSDGRAWAQREDVSGWVRAALAAAS